MTIRPYIYGTNADSGTGTHATVNTGSDIVTGVGLTAFTGISFADWFSMGGVAVPVLEITDDSHLKLAYVWPGGNIVAGAYTISAGIDPTDARRYGWFVANYYQRLQSIPTDTVAFRDQAIAAAADSAASAVTSANSATLSQAWANTAYNTNVPGAAGGSRSSLHYSVIASQQATAATTNGAAQVSLAAAQVVLATAQVAIAQAWASAPPNTDVTAFGTRSSLHYANAALIIYNNAVNLQTTVQGYVTVTSQNVQLSADWAQKAVGLDVNGVGTRSSYHWSTIAQSYSNSASSFASNSAASAAAAAASALVLGSPDYGLITAAPTDFVDYG